MKEHGLIFKGALIPPLIDGTKTLTRRMLKLQPKQYSDNSWFWQNKKFDAGYCHTSKSRMMGFMLEHGEYQIGDRIWVRETFGYEIRNIGGTPHEKFVYRASKPEAVRCYDCNGNELPMKWTPSIHMPRRASRIEREIINVRVEQLQDITDRDAIREGFKAIEGAKWQTFEEAEAGLPMHDHTARDAFEGFWRTQYGDQSWDQNPWVYVIEFKKVET